MADAESKLALGALLDFYGPLLTEHRAELVRLYCEEDMSLAEIADTVGITRQGVSDALNKARRQLESYEQRLGLAARYRAIRTQAELGLDALVRAEAGDGPALQEAKGSFLRIIQIER